MANYNLAYGGNGPSPVLGLEMFPSTAPVAPTELAPNSGTFGRTIVRVFDSRGREAITGGSSEADLKFIETTVLAATDTVALIWLPANVRVHGVSLKVHKPVAGAAVNVRRLSGTGGNLLAAQSLAATGTFHGFYAAPAIVTVADSMAIEFTAVGATLKGLYFTLNMYADDLNVGADIVL
jgi:hypothetical protein